MAEKKLHILFLCGWYPSRVLPNNGDFIQRHAEAAALKHHVSVLHIISDVTVKETFEFFYSDINNVHTYIAYIKPSKTPLIKGYRFLKAFFILLKKTGKVNLVHLNKLFPFGLLALYLKWFCKIPYIISEHWTGYHFPQANNIHKPELFFSKIIVKNAAFICPVSDNLKEAMVALGLTGNYQKVPNVVDTDLFLPSSEKNKVFTILHVSNMLDNHKNVSGIIKTMVELSKHTSDFQLILIGENSNNYKPLAKKLNIDHNILFLKHLPHQEIVSYMQRAHVFVLFSNYENLPCVILESFACGTPVISTYVGGISEYFPDDFGFLIEPDNEKQLVSSLLKIYNAPTSNSQEMHKFAQHYFSKLSIATLFDSLYKKALS
ncbi:glycosyltransferase [Tenacibaculum sp. TC6]|uniref:glycosyltransferase n=1 Tax=Tenacibaculum sp. TC6 TaxID=3423223 RepID=UPI003D36C9EE